MEPQSVTQLITVGATLCGVVLTLLTNAYLERRKVRDADKLEARRRATEHATWLRDQRLQAYSALSLAGENAQQFLRSELAGLIKSPDADLRAALEKVWGDLRTDLRKAYNQVSLFGAPGPRLAAGPLWRVARNTGNDILGALIDPNPDVAALAERLRAAVSEMGVVGDHFLSACRDDLQPPRPVASGA